MNTNPKEINDEIQNCKTIAQINKLYAKYFKEFMVYQEKIGRQAVLTGKTDPTDIVMIQTIALIFDIIVAKEKRIMLELANNN